MKKGKKRRIRGKQGVPKVGRKDRGLFFVRKNKERGGVNKGEAE